MSDEDNLRTEIAIASLEHVPFDGWTQTSLNLGAADRGHSLTTVARLFPDGLAQWAVVLSSWGDSYMVNRLEAHDLMKMRIRDKIALSVKLRIMADADHREALRRCLSWSALPLNFPMATKNIANTSNEIWHAIGDQSTDWNYYTKRGFLMPIYVTTVLYWLSDIADSEGDYPNTWEYLHRRIDNLIYGFSWPRKLKEKMGVSRNISTYRELFLNCKERLKDRSQQKV